MEPVLFSIKLPLLGEVTFPAYFTLLTVGFAFATWLTWRDAKRLEIDPDRIIDINLYMVIFGVIGSRLLHVIADGHLLDYVHMCTAPETIRAVGNVPASCTADAQCAPYFLCNVAAGHCHPPRDCLLALKVWRGGLTYYGGFIAAVAFALWYIRKHRLPMWRVCDLAGYAVPLGLFWGRMGCFLNGCCFGKPTTSALGVVFPRGGAAWRHQLEAGMIAATARSPLAVHPAQLYLALLDLGVFFVCYAWIRPRKRFDGQVWWWFVLLYCVVRSAVEVLRDDDRGVLFGFLSTSQLLSVPFFVLAIVMLRRLGRRAAAAAAAPAPETPAPAAG
jgi:phosphatidylglycerol:prolipoprotein diacylglycerol transferase